MAGLSKEQQDSIYSLFDDHLDAGLAWVRKEGAEYIPSVDNNLATSLALTMQVCLMQWFMALQCIDEGISPLHDFVLVSRGSTPSKGWTACLHHCINLCVSGCAWCAMQSLLSPSRGLLAPGCQDEAFGQAIKRTFAFAYVWALGGNLAPAARAGFDEHVREQLQDVVSFPGMPWV